MDCVTDPTVWLKLGLACGLATLVMVTTSQILARSSRIY